MRKGSILIVLALIGLASGIAYSAHQGIPVAVTLCSSTATPTTSGTSEEVLYSCEVPASTLAANGSGVRVECWGQSGSTATINLLYTYFGSARISARGTLSANTIISNYSTVLRASQTSQTAHGYGLSSGGNELALGGVVSQIQPTEDTAGVITVTCEAQTATAGNFTGRGFLVIYLPPPQ